eukprot:CAMPEP_0181297922 /NCGR_PEP_ID=MMETSP1101-20121128/5504_1 /TAXON_ID=46948 /ORGANISM="Rhodomonas abbreviata, Strain Caron Lab Isolate" /LENGTH=409 /DNA_ID=CAMNT_0023402903 /DNA_START=309 /DNA_END=1539 /DNA_ORIENTATION=-
MSNADAGSVVNLPTQLDPSDIEVHLDKSVGSGTNGEVFEATVLTGPFKGARAVAKRAKVEFSDATSQAEGGQGAIKDGFLEGGEEVAALCQASLEVESFMGRRCQEACAQFVPKFYGELEKHGSKWLVWEHAGSTSLEHLFQQASEQSSLKPIANALKMKNFKDGSLLSLARLAEVMALQLFEGCWALESAGIAHRDIKPENILVSEATGRMLVIDFGSAACMGEFPFVGYDYNVAPCDANWCPPERFIDEREWNKYDVYSVALIMMRLLMQPMWAENRYRSFRDSFFTADDDIDSWFSAIIRKDPAVMSIRAVAIPFLSARDQIKEYERIASLSCTIEKGEKAIDSLCCLKDGLSVLKGTFGFRYETLRALLHKDPSHRPSAREALFSLFAEVRSGKRRKLLGKGLGE